MEEFLKHQNKWTFISKSFEGRSVYSIKNRFETLIRKNEINARSPFLKEKLQHLIEKFLKKKNLHEPLQNIIRNNEENIVRRDNEENIVRNNEENIVENQKNHVVFTPENYINYVHFGSNFFYNFTLFPCKMK